RREQELQAREAALSAKQEHIRKHGRNNWPPGPFPILFHDIEVDIPEAHRPTVLTLYRIWMLLIIVLIVNLVSAILLLISGANNGGADLGAAIMYLPVIGVLSFFTWYQPVYKAYQTGYAVFYYIFFLFGGFRSSFLLLPKQSHLTFFLSSSQTSLSAPVRIPYPLNFLPRKSNSLHPNPYSLSFAEPPAPPLVLGRQSTASKTRLPNESPIYTNSSNNGLRAPVRPDKKVKTLYDIIVQSESLSEGGVRGTWLKGGEKIMDVVLQLRAGLLATLGHKDGVVAVQVEDPTDALLVTLALALTNQKPIVISPGSTLPAGTHVTAIIQSSTLFSPAQQLSPYPNAKWISLGSPTEKSAEAEELLKVGKALLGDATMVVEAQPSEVALTIVSEGILLGFTHLNLTASLVAWLSLYPGAPRSTRPTKKDVLVSFHHPSTPYGFGLSLLALYTSSALSLPTLSTPSDADSLTLSLRSPSHELPTLIFAPSSTLSSPLYKLVLSNLLGDSAFIVRHARDAKLALLREGVVSQSTWWDKLIFTSLRTELGLHKLRGLVIEGETEQNRIDFLRLVFGIPVQVTKEHAFLLAPVCAGGMWDFQRLPPPGLEDKDMDGSEKAHVGPPVAGMEVKLRGLEKDIIAGRIRGEILLRTPILPPASTLPSSLLIKDEQLPQLPAYPGRVVEEMESGGAVWLRSGVKAEMAQSARIGLTQSAISLRSNFADVVDRLSTILLQAQFRYLNNLSRSRLHPIPFLLPLLTLLNPLPEIFPHPRLYR
ncbi:secretory carrier-associated membrane protein, partial [Phenoliferia sp. Uapishka_3]